MLYPKSFLMQTQFKSTLNFERMICTNFITNYSVYKTLWRYKCVFNLSLLVNNLLSMDRNSVRIIRDQPYYISLSLSLGASSLQEAFVPGGLSLPARNQLSCEWFVVAAFPSLHSKLNL